MTIQPVKCGLHSTVNCLKCMPPDEYYRWQIAHDEISIFYLPYYRSWRNGREHERSAANGAG